MAAVAKTRSRKDGAAIPLDEADKRLLNLMQGSFPLAERPYAEVARLAELTEDETLRRTQRLLDERIIREVTPIFDTRALGYSSMLVAAKVDPDNPHRAAATQPVVKSRLGIENSTRAGALILPCWSRRGTVPRFDEVPESRNTFYPLEQRRIGRRPAAKSPAHLHGRAIALRW